MNSPSLTLQQQRAISARGDVLVVAGAGSGKTQTVVDRCLAWLLDEAHPGSIDQILMVTFTQAAATEMRHRLRQNLEAAQARLAQAGTPSRHLAEQLALLDTAHISTLHSFCFQLVSRHFYELGLDPKARILPEERARLLERQSLDAILNAVYDGTGPGAVAIQKLIQAQGGDWDVPVRDLILRLHHYSQTLRDPAAWFARQTALFQQTEPVVWLGWLMVELAVWRNEWLTTLHAQPEDNKNAAQCAQALTNFLAQPSRAEYTAALEAVLQADESWPKPKGPWRKPIENIFDEAEFLQSVCAVKETDPLGEDWDWARQPMLALLDLAAQFEKAYREAKRQEGGIDYHDLEQFALRLLWDKTDPSDIARQWRARFHLIFVDEFQDINEAQEAIIQALGREGAEANRFLVGDVKQSIYGFRLADPRIFGRYQEEWESTRPDAQVIPLTENFRSHEVILKFVNSVFANLMRRAAGGIEYDHSAHLRFGNAAKRSHLAAGSSVAPPIELHLRCLGRESEDGDAAGALESLSDVEKEARLVALRLLELKSQQTKVCDRAGDSRAATWRDMVVLLRSPRNKVEAYAKEFGRLGIPLSATRGGFYESLEVRDLLGMLRVLDNPLQDLPLLGVLHSPLVGLTAAELAIIRTELPQGRYWLALQLWHLKAKTRDALYEKVDEFMRRHAAWRKISRRSAVSHCLETIIDETHYGDWLATQERGAQKRANIERLLQMARQFDTHDGESLYRFLNFAEAQQESDVASEPVTGAETDAVRLMSIHQSKGLEFPIVVLADLGKNFNEAGLHYRIILDEEYGLCPQIQPPETPQFYPSLPHWLAQRRQKRKILGEEMRLLYVALTRAGQRLILVGTTGKNRLENRWPSQAETAIDVTEILSARNYLDWLGPWLIRSVAPGAWSETGRNELLQWTVYNEDDPRLGQPVAVADSPHKPDQAAAPTITAEQRALLSWQYPHLPETRSPAKTTVTTIRRQISDADGEESFPLFAPSTSRPRGRLNAAEIGLAHHTFLQWMSFDQAQSAASLTADAARLVREKLLTREQAAALNFEALAAFWQSPAGRQFLSQSNSLQRELAFTARFSAAELQQLGAKDFLTVGDAEFVVVQGVMDLAAILPGEIWLLDFKTDHFSADELAKKIETYRPQIALYALALERIHHRPVTKRWLHFLGLQKTILL